MSKAPQRREKQQWTIEQTRLDNAGKLGGIYFNDPDDLEFTETMINAREKLESPMESAMPCNVQHLQRREACGKEPNIRRSRYACIVGAHESARKRLERTPRKDYEVRIAGKGFNSLSHYNFARNFIPMPKR